MWAKTGEGLGWHPLMLHCLDVAAAALAILQREPGKTRRQLAQILGCSWEEAKPWLLLVIAASVFVVSFLLAALVAVVLVSLWSLVTGRKPAPVVMFSRMREQSQRYTQSVWPGAARGEPPADVVDVQATEVSNTSRRGDETPVVSSVPRTAASAAPALAASALTSSPNPVEDSARSRPPASTRSAPSASGLTRSQIRRGRT